MATDGIPFLRDADRAQKPLSRDGCRLVLFFSTAHGPPLPRGLAFCKHMPFAFKSSRGAPQCIFFPLILNPNLPTSDYGTVAGDFPPFVRGLFLSRRAAANFSYQRAPVIRYLTFSVISTSHTPAGAAFWLSWQSPSPFCLCSSV